MLSNANAAQLYNNKTKGQLFVFFFSQLFSQAQHAAQQTQMSGIKKTVVCDNGTGVCTCFCTDGFITPISSL